MKFYLGVTDYKWWSYLSNINPEDVNFWQPGGKTTFKVLDAAAPFLFKLHSPYNAIAGVGFFSTHSFLPVKMTWEIFGNRNGANSFSDFQKMIFNYKKNSTELNPVIGCIVLTSPVFFKQEDWIIQPDAWSKSIVQGKSYNTETSDGASIWDQVETLLRKYSVKKELVEKQTQFELTDPNPGFGYSYLKRIRLGQGAFRVMVTDAFQRKCAISGERTLPVLEAAHIKPYSESGPHLISNSLLLRSDLHKLFDSYYITVTNENNIEVSKRIKEEFENGREYYKFHGNKLHTLPELDLNKPGLDFINWHNNKYKG